MLPHELLARPQVHTGRAGLGTHSQQATDFSVFMPHSAVLDGRYGRTELSYGDALWCGIFDAAYTHPGDYLVQHDATWFIATQQRLLPVLCVQTNRVISFARPAAQAATGVNTYGGVTAGGATLLS